MSPSSAVPDPPAAPQLSGPPADPFEVLPEEEPAEQRSSVLLVILMLLANLVFVILVYPVAALSELNAEISPTTAGQVNIGRFLFWPGMVIVWGAAWLGFLIFGLRNRIRSALWAFVLIATLWLFPVTLYLIAAFAGA